MKEKIKIIKIKYIVILFITIAALLLLSAFYEISSSRKGMYELLNEQANSIIKIVTTSGENNILASREVENLIVEKLYTIADHYIFLDSLNQLSKKEINNYIKKYEMSIVCLYDRKGKIQYSSALLPSELRDSLEKTVQYIFQERETRVTLGVISEESEPNYYFIADKRAKRIGGAVVIGVDVNYFKAFRKKIGIGKLIQKFGFEKGIKYIALQDYLGIIVASKNVSELVSIESDSFLVNAIKHDTLNSRITKYAEEDVLEIATPIFAGEETKSLLRIGISLDNLREMDKRMTRRMIIISIILVGVGIVVFGFILINRHYSSLQIEYRKIQSYTDNILENMADGVIALDKENKVLFLNKNIENLFALNPSEATGREINAIFESSEIIQIIKKRFTVTDKEISIIKKDGNNLLMRISISYVYSAENEIEIIIIVLQDITEESRLNLQVRRNEKLVAMGELAAGVAHEVRNPLNSIAIITQRLQYEYEPKEDIEGFNKSINTIKNEIYRLNAIIEQFLKFARKPKLNLQNYNLSDLLDSIIDLVNKEAEEKKIQIYPKYKVNPIILLDPEQMKQAILNIIKNCFEAMPTGGDIKISLDKYYDKYLLEIADTGIGIPKENLTKLFNLYFSTKSSGSGIGLSLVNQIISEHNGKIEVESEPGKGTKFRIYL